METARQISLLAAQSGFSAWSYISVDQLQYHPEIRQICEGNLCRNYGTSWACPPAIGTLEACKARLKDYNRMLLFSRFYPLEDSFDFEGMKAGMVQFKKTVDAFQQLISPHLSRYLLLSNEGCGRCKQCTYPHAPCRFPQLLHHSLEGYGWIISDLAREAGIPYINGPNTVTYFGALCFHT